MTSDVAVFEELIWSGLCLSLRNFHKVSPRAVPIFPQNKHAADTFMPPVRPTVRNVVHPRDWFLNPTKTQISLIQLSPGNHSADSQERRPSLNDANTFPVARVGQFPAGFLNFLGLADLRKTSSQFLR